ncbi:MAG: TIGR04086 family membrane protein [Chloroflexi bacterium]|nr:TIGR04086 family membrane protein [Chloroflexota bacterium]
MINEFAASNALGITSIFIGIGTLVGGLLAGRKVKEDALQNGLMVGLVTAILGFVLSLFGGFSVWAIVSFIFALGGGWLGGKLSSR